MNGLARAVVAAVVLSAGLACGGPVRVPRLPAADGGAAPETGGAARGDAAAEGGAGIDAGPPDAVAATAGPPADGAIDVGAVSRPDLAPAEAGGASLDAAPGPAEGGRDAAGPEARRRPDGGPPAELRGTPAVSDPGAGPARAGAGFYRLAFQAWGPGLSFPADARTAIDFYYASDQEVVSNGLGGKPSRVPVAVGQALVFQIPYGDELELVLDTARVPPHTFTHAFLRERGIAAGTDDQFPYPGIVNKVAEPPFAGGPRQAPAGPFVPGVFALGTAPAALACTSAARLQGQDATFTLGKSYEVALERDGSVRVATDGAALVRPWSELTDKYVWPDAAGRSTLRLADAARGREIVVRHDGRRVVEVTWTVSSAEVFASYVLAAP
jgi:hypothetical protein